MKSGVVAAGNRAGKEQDVRAVLNGVVDRARKEGVVVKGERPGEWRPPSLEELARLKPLPDGGFHQRRVVPDELGGTMFTAAVPQQRLHVMSGEEVKTATLAEALGGKAFRIELDGEAGTVAHKVSPREVKEGVWKYGVKSP